MKKLLTLASTLAALTIFTNPSTALVVNQKVEQQRVPTIEAVAATTLNGKITNKDTGFTVLTVGVRPISVKVGINANTTFSLNGVATNFEGINVGDWVVVEYLPFSDRPVNALSVEAHRRRRGSVNDLIEPPPPAPGYPFCPHVGSGGTIENQYIPCYCKKCADKGSGMVWG